MNNVSRAVLGIAALGVTICCARAVSAQTLSDQQVRGCAAQSNSAARLACYDELAASVSKGGTASGAGDGSSEAGTTGPDGRGAPVNAAAAADSPSSPESQFGIAGGRLEQKKEAVTPKEIQAVVSGVARRPRGELVITLDNGQVWAQLLPQEYYPLKIGDTVHISKGALGSYSLTTPAKRGSKVTRLL